MPLLKEHPTIRATVPSYAHPGDRIEVEVHLESEEEVPLRRMTCQLRGRASALGETTLCLQEATFLEDAAVPRGASSYRMIFELPEDLPPSYALVAHQAFVSYRLVVRLDIPWWPDAERCFSLNVEHPPVTVEDDPPQLHASHVDGPSGTDPYVEFTLSAYHVVPGDSIEGELALWNTGFNQLRTATVRLVAAEKQRGGTGPPRTVERIAVHGIEIDIRAIADGEPVPFALSVPDDIAQSYDSVRWTLSWKLEIALSESHGRHLTVSAPMTVLPRASTVLRPEGVTTPKLGGGRTAKIWGDVAAQHELTFDEDATEITGHRGEVGVRIYRRHRGEEGLCAIAELRFPWLGIGLAGGRATEHGLQDPGRIPLGQPAWDERHVIRARERGQLSLFLSRDLTRALSRLRLATAEDDRLVVYQDEAGQNHEPFLAFVTHVLDLAEALPQARARIPPPAAMARMVPVWERVAQRLDGELTVGDMSVTGRWEGHVVRIRTLWTADGKADGTRWLLFDDGVVAENAALFWRGGRYLRGDTTKLTEPARAALAAVQDRATELSVEPHRLVLVDRRGPLDDEALVLKRIAELTKLAALLRGRTSPYR